TKFFRGPAREDERQRTAELIAGANEADGASAPQRRKPVGRHAHSRRPAQCLNVPIAGPDKREEIKARGPAKDNVQRRGAQQTQGEQLAGREPLGQLAVDKLAGGIRQLEGHENRAKLSLRVSEFSAE